MSNQQANPESEQPESECVWEQLPTAAPQDANAESSDALPGLLAAPFFLLLLVGAVMLVRGAWREPSKAAAPVVQRIGAGPETESCRRVTELLRNVPATEDGVKSVGALVSVEIKYVPTDAKWRDDNPGERARLATALGELRAARKDLPARVGRFIKTERYVPATVPAGETSIQEMQRAVRGFEVRSGPGHNLLGAVDAYIDACEVALGEERKAIFGGSLYR